jgi:hypothetical protein
VALSQLFKEGACLHRRVAPEEAAVSAYVGGEKMHFLHNKKTVSLLEKRYGIILDATKAGSVEMVKTLDTVGKDVLWPSNDIAVEFFKMRGGRVVKDEIVFSSPIVMYSGKMITDALVGKNIVRLDPDGSYKLEFDKLLDMIVQGKSWKELGLDQLFGKISVRCTDPTKSNSGNMFAGLVATLLNKGEMVDKSNVDAVLPQISKFFTQLGHMEHSSGDIFKKFLATGINNSIVVGYENQLVEYILAHPNSKDAVLENVRILYPVPTVWSSHPVIALNDKGKKLIDALKDEDIQKLAWKEHGFRSVTIGIENDPGVLGIPGIPKQIASVMPLPSAEAMNRIIENLLQSR